MRARTESGGMATYRRIRDRVRQHHGRTPKTCWITHCKALAGLPCREAPNRRGGARAAPCPLERRQPSCDAFRHFGMR